MYCLPNSEFNRVFDYVTIKGFCPNLDKCRVCDITLNDTLYTLTLCFNKETKNINLCELKDSTGKDIDITIENENKCLNKLTADALLWDRTVDDIKYIEWFKQNIDFFAKYCTLST